MIALGLLSIVVGLWCFACALELFQYDEAFGGALSGASGAAFILAGIRWIA